MKSDVGEFGGSLLWKVYTEAILPIIVYFKQDRSGSRIKWESEKEKEKKEKRKRKKKNNR